jgi:hypothetical protein
MRDIFYCLIAFFAQIKLVFEFLNVEKTLEISQSIVRLIFWHFCSHSSFAPNNVASSLKERLTGLVSAVRFNALIVT